MRETTCCLSGLPSIRGRDALLSEDERSLTPDERDDMLALAHRMQMGDRVPRALAFCPRSDALEDPLIGMTGCCESGARGLALTCQMQVDGKDAAMQRTSVGV